MVLNDTIKVARFHITESRGINFELRQRVIENCNGFLVLKKRGVRTPGPPSGYAYGEHGAQVPEHDTPLVDYNAHVF